MDRGDTTPGPSNSVPNNGRRDIRLAAPPRLRCVISGAAAVFTMKNISSGGFGATTNMPLGRDTVYVFEFTLDDLSLVRKARIMHCAWLDGDRWNIGAAFVHDGHESGIGQLIDRITGSALDFA